MTRLGKRTVRVETPSRLHFGLIDLNGEIGRIDGSIGLTLDKPGFVLTATTSDDIEIVGAGEYEPRARSLIERLQQEWNVGGASVAFDETIPAHSGLGSGTQLTLALIHAMARLYDVELPPTEAALLSGRGGTSGVGIYAFSQGGFLVDGGHRYPQQKSSFLPSAASRSAGVGPLLIRRDFPEWEMLLVIPNARHISGDEEVRLFQTLCPMPPTAGAHVSHWLVMRMLPALVEGDLRGFAKSLEAVQAVGWKKVEIDAQEPVVRKTMSFLRGNGADGVAMSSWGPALAVFADDVHALKPATDAFLASLPDGGTSLITRANNHGATIEVTET